MNTTVNSVAAVVLTLNEEHDLSRCLSSLAWCDEIVVLDSGSIDQTEAIANKYSARFYVRTQTPPFLITDQRNWSIHNCDITSNWVFFLDADEEVTSDLKNEILASINSHRFNAYLIAPSYIFLGTALTHSKLFPSYHPRLLKRGHISLKGGVWEQFSDSTNVGKLKSTYLHHWFSKGLSDWSARHIRYARWEAQKSSHRRLANARIAPILASLIFLLGPLRPFGRFLYEYLLRLGFLDGRPGFFYAMLMSTYELFILIESYKYKKK